MLDDKIMVSDALTGVNGELVRYGEMISQTENKELKQCLKQIRNQCEMSQEKLYQVAREKSYYVPAAKASQQEIDHVKSVLSGLSDKMIIYQTPAVSRRHFLTHFFQTVNYKVLHRILVSQSTVHGAHLHNVSVFHNEN